MIRRILAKKIPTSVFPLPLPNKPIQTRIYLSLTLKIKKIKKIMIIMKEVNYIKEVLEVMSASMT